jgi:Cft2 family RNA processing exonuclease
MLEWADDLKLTGSRLYMDSRSPRELCFISHAHSDHLGLHRKSLATAVTAALAERRIGPQPVDVFEPGAPPVSLPGDAETQVALRHAGHVLGSAMLHVRRSEETLLYTGDFKLRSSLTVPAADPVTADVLVMESTYGLPLFRFPPWQQVAEQLVDLASAALRAGRQPIVLGYSLGKAQEIVRILTAAGLPVTCHGSVAAMNDIYQQHGVPMGVYRRYRVEDFHGSAALDLAERGVLVAPPQTARSAFVTRFDNPCRIILTGWALFKNASYRYGVDHALPLSDHADFAELLELIDRVQPKKIFTHHGYREFAQTLRDAGHNATVAMPDRQLTLFGD